MTVASSFEATLGGLALRMARALELPELLDEITRGLVRDLDAAMARVWLIDSDPRPSHPRDLVLAASAGLSTRLDGTRARVAVGALKIGEIAATRRPVSTNDLGGDPRFTDKEWIAANGLVMFAGYPLEYGDRLLGVLAMFARRPLDGSELARLEVFAAHASVAIENARLFGEVRALSKKLEAENRYLKEELERDRPSAIVGQSAAMAKILGELARVAPTTSSVLLLGETGTGKELFARAIHEASARKDGPLVQVNCAALAPTLLESELFGHEKGAFTGATARRIGRFELAQGGTLFLDEVGEIPLELQAKLLRALQEREIERVGAARPVKVDVRIVAATNRDLSADVKAGRFRADLFYRLAVFPLTIPPLRERPGDVGPLAEALVVRLASTLAMAPKPLDAEALRYLEAYAWPGNVRELQNVLERALVLSRGAAIVLADLPELAVAPDSSPLADARSVDDASGSLRDQVRAYERSLIAAALAKAGDNQSEAARLLGTSRATLQYRMRLLEL